MILKSCHFNSQKMISREIVEVREKTKIAETHNEKRRRAARLLFLEQIALHINMFPPERRLMLLNEVLSDLIEFETESDDEKEKEKIRALRIECVKAVEMLLSKADEQ